jgi:1-aminocyclopropane-1-carboxylate deaminase/D-cysteine desulfhydrase-like pyridoxal-dependent ACC family enzyme
MTNSLFDFHSRVESITFRGFDFYLKRDDELHPDFSGNKARKFHFFLEHDFPKIKKVISYGSNQSNAMYSLSVLAKMRGWKFEYYVDHIPDYLREHPVGNYARALANGMVVIREEGAGSREEVGRDASTPTKEQVWRDALSSEILLVEEGGRQPEAEYGIRVLAEEILQWQEENHVQKLDIFLPSGTGTTALYLQKSFSILNSQFSTQVYTCPVVGGSEYIKKQFAMLEPNEEYHPIILELPKKYHFGKLYREFYEIWIELHQQTGVEFDLLYDPQGWLTLMTHCERLGENVMYIHQGGQLGNESMLPRYQRKYPDI